MSLTFICLAIAIHGDTLRCANNPNGNDVVQLTEVQAPDHESTDVVASAPLKELVPGRVNCQQVDANPRAAGYQSVTVEGRIVARCSARGQDLTTLLVAERGPQLRDKPRTRGAWSRRYEMTKTWLLASN